MTTDQLAIAALTSVGLALVLFGFVIGVVYCHSFDDPFRWLGAVRAWWWRTSYPRPEIREVPEPPPAPRSCVRLVRDKEAS